MFIKPVLAALVCATAGAAAWAGLLISLEREMDVLAVVIGAAIGFAASKAGGRDSKVAVACGLMAVLALVSGKLIGSQVMYDKAVEQGIEAMVSESMFEEDREAALEFVDLPDDEKADFAGRWFYDASDSGLSADQMSSFEKYDAPRLQWITKMDPDYRAWTVHRSDSLREELNDVSIVARFRVVTRVALTSL